MSFWFNIEPTTNNPLFFHEYSNIQSMGKRRQFSGQRDMLTWMMITWANSRHFETPPLFFPPNDVWETSTESHSDDVSLPRSWVVLRLWLRICFYQSQTLPWYIVHRISALVPQPSIRGETSGNFGKCWLFFFFFFSVYLMSKIILIFNLSMWICVIRSNRQKKWIWNETTPTVLPFSPVK